MERAAKVGLAAGAAGAVGLAVILATRGKPTSGAAQTQEIQLTFSGISGQVSVADGGALPTLVTAIGNPDTAAHTYTLSVTSGPIQWAPDANAFTLQPGQSRNINWAATYESSYGTGPFETIATVEVDSMPTKTFTDPTTFGVEVATAADIELQFSGGPSGTLTAAAGATITPQALGTTITNKGGTSATVAVSVAISGPISGKWYASEVNGQQLSQSTATPSVTIGPGQTASIIWGTQFDNAQPSYNGTYTNTASVSW